MSIEAMKLALEALQKIYIAPEHEEYIRVWWPACEEAITALRQAIAEAEQAQPAAWGWAIMHKNGATAYTRARITDFFGSILQERDPYTSKDLEAADREWAGLAPHSIVPLYTAPLQRKPLSDEEIGMAFRKAFPVGAVVFTNGAVEFARAIEAAINNKENT